MSLNVLLRGSALRGAIATVAGALVAVPAAAQDRVTTRTLSTPLFEYAEPFSSLSGFRELKDGRVIVADSRDKVLQVIDLATGKSEKIGREGAGPMEWSMPSRLSAYRGDSTLMTDFSNGRYFIITPEGKAGGTVREPEGERLARASFVGSNVLGQLIMSEDVWDMRDKSSTGLTHVLRFDRRTGRTDSLATLIGPKGEQNGATISGNGMIRSFTNLPLAARDIVVAAPDGRVAVVRTSPYRVEWYHADGKIVRGAPATPSAIKVTEAEKKAFLASQIRPGTFQVRAAVGGSAEGASKPRPSAADVDAMTNPAMTWPAVKPPFPTSGAMVASDGKLWVPRARAHNDSIPTYDVFDAAGRVVERVVLPKGARLLGFGKGVVYLSRSDEDELLYLQKYRY
ncbi:MAG: hypothetical protein IT357_11450 [Gemmatimonadaceae bacterium]|nr:hypothetical protein [Gemmatimonadaceae bacterium]